jgi:NADPH2:quinone reductase
MRSIIHHSFGDPADVLKPAQSPRPEPAAGEVRIKTILSPIHNHDIWTVRGNYGYKPALPAIGGSEGVGVIDALGAELGSGATTGLRIGQRVAVASVRGSWAEYFLAPANGVVPLPDSIPDEAAAQLIAMPFSAMTLLDFLDVSKGDWIIQNTANGTVGKVVAMLARSRGIHVINLVRRDEGLQELSALGIENAISTAAPDWKDQLRALLGTASLRAAVDSIGGAASADLLEVLGEDGLLVSFGAMSGQPMQIPSGGVIFKQATIRGFWGAKVSAAMPAQKRVSLIGELLRLVASGEIKLPVEAVFPLEQIREAVAASAKAGKGGKVLLRP